MEECPLPTVHTLRGWTAAQSVQVQSPIIYWHSRQLSIFIDLNDITYVIMMACLCVCDDMYVCVFVMACLCVFVLVFVMVCIYVFEMVCMGVFDGVCFYTLFILVMGKFIWGQQMSNFEIQYLKNANLGCSSRLRLESFVLVSFTQKGLLLCWWTTMEQEHCCFGLGNMTSTEVKTVKILLKQYFKNGS